MLTDAEGRFQIEVTAGLWEIEVTARDYTSRKISFEAAPQGVAPIEIGLIPKAALQERVEVTAPAPRSDGPASIPLRPKEVLSTAGSLDNPFRTLQTLPGVAGTDEFGSKLSVRGGAPDQNLTIMDGVEIHNPYRLFGLTSAFNPETVERFELMAGGFGAKYGDRLSSVVVIENREGDVAHRVGGSSSVSITDANIIVEGRLPGPGQGSWLATARRTYYDLVAERFVDQDLPSFNDAQVKTAWQLPGSRRLSVFGLRSREITSVKSDEDTDAFAEIRSRNDLVTASLVSPLAHTTSTTIVAWSRNTDLIDIQRRGRGPASSVLAVASPGPRSVHASSSRSTTRRCARRSGFRRSAAIAWKRERNGIGSGRTWRSRPATTSIPSGCFAADPCGWGACSRTSSIIRGAPPGAARGSRIACSFRPSRSFPVCDGTTAA